MASHRRDLATSGTTLTSGRTTVLDTTNNVENYMTSGSTHTVDTTAWPAFPSGQHRADVNARGLAHAPLPPGPHALPPLEPAPPQA
jgi:hypothetical protein